MIPCNVGCETISLQNMVMCYLQTDIMLYTMHFKTFVILWQEDSSSLIWIVKLNADLKFNRVFISYRHIIYINLEITYLKQYENYTNVLS